VADIVEQLPLAVEGAFNEIQNKGKVLGMVRGCKDIFSQPGKISNPANLA
jgi:hypothetical protein